jgi:hypothetical protein
LRSITSARVLLGGQQRASVLAGLGQFFPGLSELRRQVGAERLLGRSRVDLHFEALHVFLRRRAG